MRKSIVYWAAVMAVAAMAAGCQKDGLEIVPEEPAVEPERTDGLPKGAFRLTTEGDEGGTKTMADGNKVYWMVGDVVNVNGNDYAIKYANNQFYIEPGKDNTPPIEGDKIYGYYNCGDVKKGMTTQPKVTIPSEYECGLSLTDSKVQIALPMAAYGDKSAGMIQFKQLTAALSLTIINSTGFPLKLDEVTLIGNDKILSGLTPLNFDDTDYALESQDGSSTVALHIQEMGTGKRYTLAKDASVTVQVPFRPVSNAEVNILVRANSNYMAVSTNQNIDADDYYGVPNTDYEFRYSYTPDAKLTLARNQMMTASVTLKRAADSNGRVTEVDHGLFSAAENNYRIVRFSKGNLRYNAKAASDQKWTFHEHQYDVVGTYNEYIGENYNGNIDLFGWATSGYDNGQTCYKPWSYQDETSEYTYYSGTGVWSVQQQQSGPWVPTTLDWAYNLIYENLYSHFNWHTPSKTMWKYIIFVRDEGKKWGNGTIAGREGCILLPDDWVQPYGVPQFQPQNLSSTYNAYSAEEWKRMEKAGAVFLPVTGWRNTYDGVSIKNLNIGYYWTSTYYLDEKASVIKVEIGREPDAEDNELTNYGNAVRLVAYVN